MPTPTMGILVDSELDPGRVDGWLRNATLGRSVRPVVVDIRSDRLAATGDATAGTVRPNSALKNNLEALRWFHEWSLRRQPWGSVTEALRFQDVSLWYFVQAWFFGSLIVPSESLRHILAWIRRISRACDELTPDVLVTLDCSRSTQQIAEVVGASRRIEVRHAGRAPRRFPHARGEGIEALKVLKSLARYVTARLWARPKPESVWLLGMSLGIDQFMPDGPSSRFVDPLVDGTAAEVTRRPGDRTVALIEFDVTHGAGIKRVARQKPPYLPFELFTRLADVPESWRASRTVRANVRKLAEDPRFRASFTYCGVQFWPLIAGRWRALERWRIPEAVRLIAGVDRIVAELRPRVVLVSDELSRFGCAFVTAARRRLIPTVNLQHGSYLDECYPGFVPACGSSGMPAAADVPQADVAAVYDQHAKDWVVRRGAYSQQAVEIVGRPTLNIGAPGGAGRFGDGSDRPVMLFAGSLALRDDGIACAFRAATALNMVLLVRPHPRESVHRYRRIARMLRTPMTLCRREAISTLLTACDVLVTGPSTVMADAVAMRKPAILLSFENASYSLEFARDVPTAADADELVERVTEVLSKARQSSVDDLEVPGAAARAVVDLLDSLTARSA